MSRIRVAPIVEGYGEVAAFPILLRRIGEELLGVEYVEVLKPVRQPKSKLLKPEETKRAVKLAASKLANAPLADESLLVLLLLDADKDPACTCGPQLMLWMQEGRLGVRMACVLAVMEYETWFVAAAESLSEYLQFSVKELPDNPEELRLGKGWIKKHYINSKYSETLDQPRMTAAMDLHKCRQRSPSFDKLCRELEKCLT